MVALSDVSFLLFIIGNKTNDWIESSPVLALESRQIYPPTSQVCRQARYVLSTAVILFLDEKKVASFGNTKFHPVYLTLANLSAEMRQDSGNLFPVAFLPVLDFASHFDSGLAADLPLSGVELEMGDGMRRRIFPRMAYFGTDITEGRTLPLRFEFLCFLFKF